MVSVQSSRSCITSLSVARTFLRCVAGRRVAPRECLAASLKYFLFERRITKRLDETFNGEGFVSVAYRIRVG